MVKATLAGMDTHLALDLTQLASAWLVTRLDGQQFRFTTNTRDVDIDIGDGNGVQTYSANEGYSRTNIANDSELSVGNLDIGGVFDNAQLDETEMRRGLFDFADVKIFFFNFTDISDGIIKIIRGTFGEVIVTDKGLFKTTLRDMTTVFDRLLGEKVSKDCRDDLGGPFCRVPVFPDPVAGSTAYAVGDFVRIPNDLNNEDCSVIVMNFEDTDGSTGLPGMANLSVVHAVNPTVNATAQIDTAQIPAGGSSTSSLLLDGNSDYLNWADADLLDMGNGPVTIHGHFRLNVTGVNQTLCSKYQASSTNRTFYLRVNTSNQLEFSVWQTGSTLDITLTGTTALTTGVNYHFAIVRKNDGDWVLFLDGGIEDGPDTPTANPFNGVADFRIGALESGGVSQFFNGWIDSFQYLPGVAQWEVAFTAPTGNLATPVAQTDFATRPWVDFDDTIFEATVAGTTNPCIAPADFTFGNTHPQGGVTFTARRSWSRLVTVTALGSNVRRDFEVTELTPNTGHTTGAGPYTATYGYPDDFMNGGIVIWETGNNAGIGPKTNMEIRDFVADDGVTITQDIELFTNMPFDIQIGDTARVVPGCDKVFQTCIDKYNNPNPFKGEPFVPGSDTLGQYPDAPSG